MQTSGWLRGWLKASAKALSTRRLVFTARPQRVAYRVLLTLAGHITRHLNYTASSIRLLQNRAIFSSYPVDRNELGCRGDGYGHHAVGMSY